jgi:hypothetical protein
MAAQLMAETIQGTFWSFLDLDEVIHHKTMSPHDEIEGTLGFPDPAFAQNEDPYPEDID